MGSNPDPDPVDGKITGLEPGGGVPPGETPPGEGSVADPVKPEVAPLAGKIINKIWLVIIGLGVVLALLFFVGRIFGAFALLGSS
ncbi:DUF6480 family protein [Arthrobacter antibioticus]|uniref:DUF6480 family protein n=1 Tax=Arthrobacter sp. H35-MC1 TaxID=3046203 RepID=UPI0024BAC02E|nr:DUF6480 family protein [Arthrobacter sp. H35-MC1]MDJ0315789.1 DUF6480 family protein [Arthrobacter sp. H35-MC1]